VQIDSVGLQSFYAIWPYMDREALPENPETSASSPTSQERIANCKDLLSSNVTLDQLLDAGSQPDKLELETDKANTYEWRELPKDIQEKMNVNYFAWHIVIYERDRRNAAMRRAVESGRYKAAADEKIDDLLGSVNALLKDAELTGEQSEALRIFNSKVNQVKDGFDPFYYDKENRVYGYSTDGLFAGLQSAFDTLTESFNSVMESTPALKRELENLFAAKFSDVQSSMKDALGVPDLTKEDITSLLAKYIGTYAETEEQKMEDQQFAKDFMPEIIEKIEHYMQDFLHCNVKYS